MKPLVSLYRKIIWAAKRFPSKNRLKVLEEIRIEFRKNKSMTPEQAQPKIALAHDSLNQLMAYVKLGDDKNQKDSNWTINLHQNPMPRRM